MLQGLPIPGGGLRTLFVNLLIVAEAFILAMRVEAAPANKAQQPPIAQMPSVQPARALTVKIEGVREHLAVGSNFGVTGTLTNNTNSTVCVNEQYLRLKLPGEVEGPGAWSTSYWAGFLPAASHGLKGKETWDNATLALRPNDSTPVFWFVKFRELATVTGSQSQSQSLGRAIPEVLAYLYEQISMELNFLLFVPGNYQVTVIADYWVKDDCSDIPDIGVPNVAFESKIVDVAAPQSVILVGAAIGGLISYVILPQARRRQRNLTGLARYAAIGTGAFGAMLLSTIITILLARISESQFLIRVTVTDVWGAIAIGFISNYFGVEILNKIIGATKDSAEKEGKEQQPGSVKDSNHPA